MALYSWCYLYLKDGEMKAIRTVSDLPKITLPVTDLSKMNPGLSNLNACVLNRGFVFFWC